MSFHIIGDEDTVVGFRFAGVTGSAVENADEAREAFQRVVGE
ncbi:MAG: ATPase V, partial [Lentisphaerae bacterium]|nr:ATPase V [Lentisphaerota bacterium]